MFACLRLSKGLYLVSSSEQKVQVSSFFFLRNSSVVSRRRRRCRCCRHFGFFYIFIFLFRTTGLTQPNLAQCIPWCSGFNFFQIKRPLFPWGDNYEMAKTPWQTYSSTKPLVRFQHNFAQNILGWKGFKFVLEWRTIQISKK